MHLNDYIFITSQQTKYSHESLYLLSYLVNRPYSRIVTSEFKQPKRVTKKKQRICQ